MPAALLPDDRPVLVTAATGTTGRRVADRLVTAGHRVRAVCRSTPIPFDWHDRTTWAGAVDGACAAYLAFAPDLAFPGAADTVGGFARFAVDHGVRRLVLLSGRGEAGARRAEQLVQGAGAEWTIVRSACFAQNFTEGAFAGAVAAGELALPVADVAEPFVDVDDIAEIASAALVDDRHAGQIYEVTGPRSITFGAALAIIGDVIGRPVTYVRIGASELRAGLVDDGLAAEDAAHLVELFGEILDGRNTAVAHGVQRALGRPPRDVADVIVAAAATGAWTSEEVA